MNQIKEILLVLNSFENLSTILEKSFATAKKFNAKVSILYVYEKPFFSIKELFKNKDATLNKTKVKEYLKEKVASYTNEDIAILVKIDDTASEVWDIVRDDKSFLIITPYHKKIAKALVDKLEQNIFFLQTNHNKYTKTALVVESLVDIQNTLELGKKLFTDSIKVLYNFYYVPDVATVDPTLTLAIESNIQLLESEENRFKEFLQEHSLDGEFFVNSVLGDETLSEYIQKEHFDSILYQQEEEILLLEDDLALELLEENRVDCFIKKNFAI
jgi:hypothetical protein